MCKPKCASFPVLFPSKVHELAKGTYVASELEKNELKRVLLRNAAREFARFGGKEFMWIMNHALDGTNIVPPSAPFYDSCDECSSLVDYNKTRAEYVCRDCGLIYDHPHKPTTTYKENA